MDRDEIRCDFGGADSVSFDGKRCRGNSCDPSVSARGGLVGRCGSDKSKFECVHERGWVRYMRGLGRRIED